MRKSDWVKLVFSIALFVASIDISAWIGMVVESTLSGASTEFVQLGEAAQLIPLFFALGLVSRYSGRLVTTVPKTRKETIYRFEQSVVRGVVSLSVFLMGLLWWFITILTTEMLGHPLFSWAMLFIVPGLWLTLWYHSKIGVYRASVAGSDRSETFTGVLPNTASLAQALLRANIRLERFGLQRGLPSLVFNFSPDGESEYNLIFGLDRLMPTFIGNRNDSQNEQVENGEETPSEAHLREVLRTTARTHAERILLLTHFAEQHQSKKGVTVSDLEDLFYQARTSPPKSISIEIDRLCDQDCLMEIKKGPGKYCLTAEGMDRVEMLLHPVP